MGQRYPLRNQRVRSLAEILVQGNTSPENGRHLLEQLQIARVQATRMNDAVHDRRRAPEEHVAVLFRCIVPTD